MSDIGETVLDARGLLCPMPVIRTQDRVKQLAPGAVLDVLATDPGVLHDIPAWCRVHGHDVLETTKVDREIRLRLRVGARRLRPA
jgi:tRNA 2-thiouridine synthesizing protein A